MTRDDATVLDRLGTGAVPLQRTARTAPESAEPAPPPRRTHPLTEYWDVENARWISRAPVPGTRPAD